MSGEVSNRRQIMMAVVGAGLGALIPSAVAQPSTGGGEGRLTAERVGEVHERAFAQIREALGSDGPNTRAGLHKLVDLLRKSNFIDDSEAKLLNDLVEALYSDLDIAKVEKEVGAMLEAAKAKSKDLTIAIVSVALSSIQWVKKEVADHKRAMFIVSGDVSGACLGAAACLALGPFLAVVSAVSGAVTGSCTAFYASR